MATHKPCTPPAPHSLFRASFERHRHLIGPMLDGDEEALAALTGSEDAFRAALHARFCHDDTPHAIYARHQDARDLQPHFDHPIQIVAREHPAWIGNVLLDPAVTESEIGQEIQESLFYWIGLAFLSGMGDPEFMDEEALLASLGDDEEDEEEPGAFVPDRELPASLGEYCLSLFRGERTASTSQRLTAIQLLANFRPLPPDAFAVLGGCILGERDRDTKALMIRLLDSDEAAAHMDPALVPKLKTLRSRLRRTMDPAVGEALDRIITRLGGTPPAKAPPRVFPEAPNLFPESFQRHHHLIGPMLDEDREALAALTATEDGFRAALHARFGNDTTRYPIKDRYPDWRDRAPHYEHPIHVVAREHPAWIGNVLLDPTVDANQREEGIRASLFRAIVRVFLPDEIDLEFMTPEEQVEVTSDRPLPAPIGEYALAVVKGERDADAPWYYDAMALLTDFRPIPPGTHEALGRCIVSEPFREVKERLILFMDSDDATRHMDPALVPELRKIRSRLRRTMSKRAGEALDRIIVRLGGTPPVARPRKAPSQASAKQETRQPHPLFREEFEQHRHLIEPMLNGDEQALAALAASEAALRASLYPHYCDDDTDYTIHQEPGNWRDRSDLFHRPLFRVLEEHPEWVENLLRDPVLDRSNVGKMIRSNVRVYAQLRGGITCSSEDGQG